MGKDPLNMTGLHNASAGGIYNTSGYSLSAEKAKSKKGKSFRKVFHLNVAHLPRHGAKTWKKGSSSSNGAVTTMTIKRTANKAAKVVKALPFANASTKTTLLKRLGRLNASLTETK